MTPYRILVTDDERPLALAISYKLKAAGYSVEIAYNGEDALEKIKKESFDLILLDLIMPKKDGFEVLADLKLLGNKVPVIVSSNLSQEEEAKRALDLGASRIIIKSDTSLNQLISCIEETLEGTL